MTAEKIEDRRRRKLAKMLARLRPPPRTAPKKKSAKHPRQKLTVKRIERLIHQPGRYGDEHRGLYLQIRSRTNASWLYRYSAGGRERWLGLGPLATISRDEAVELAKAADRTRRGYVATTMIDGAAQHIFVPSRDPIEARRAEVGERKTFKSVAAEYLAAHHDNWRNKKYREQATAVFERYVYPLIGNKAVADIDLKDVLKVLEQTVPEERGLPGGMFYKVRPETAERCRRRMEGVITRAIISGERPNKTNPVAWENNLKELIPPPKIDHQHHNTLPFKDVPAFMAELRAQDGIAARALEFAILNANRTGEVIGAQWSEIDLDAATWVIPGSRMKAGKRHEVPLAPRAVEILRALPREDGNPFVFIGGKAGRGLSNMAMLVLLQKRMNRRDITVHGFRSSFKNWATEVAHFPDEVSEAALAHLVGSEVRRAYAHGSFFMKRRKLAEAWARYCSSPAQQKTSRENVVTTMQRRSA
jgi:integrase